MSGGKIVLSVAAIAALVHFRRKESDDVEWIPPIYDPDEDSASLEDGKNDIALGELGCVTNNTFKLDALSNKSVYFVKDSAAKRPLIKSDASYVDAYNCYTSKYSSLPSERVSFSSTIIEWQLLTFGLVPVLENFFQPQSQDAKLDWTTRFSSLHKDYKSTVATSQFTQLFTFATDYTGVKILAFDWASLCTKEKYKLTIPNSESALEIVNKGLMPSISQDTIVLVDSKTSSRLAIADPDCKVEICGFCFKSDLSDGSSITPIMWTGVFDKIYNWPVYTNLENTRIHLFDDTQTFQTREVARPSDDVGSVYMNPITINKTTSGEKHSSLSVKYEFNIKHCTHESQSCDCVKLFSTLSGSMTDPMFLVRKYSNATVLYTPAHYSNVVWAIRLRPKTASQISFIEEGEWKA